MSAHRRLLEAVIDLDRDAYHRLYATNADFHATIDMIVRTMPSFMRLIADEAIRADREHRQAEALMSKQMYVPEPEEHTYRRSTAKAWYQDASDTFILTQVPMPQPDDAMVVRRCSGRGETYHATWTSHPKPVCGLDYGMDTPVYPEAKLSCHYCKRIIGRTGD